MSSVITCFIENGNRYNLLNSAIIELFEYIRVVCSYFLISITSADIFRNLNSMRLKFSFVIGRPKTFNYLYWREISQ